ncbi:hypothetical protein [Dactylosporangium sp. CA-092794]
MRRTWRDGVATVHTAVRRACTTARRAWRPDADERLELHKDELPPRLNVG